MLAKLIAVLLQAKAGAISGVFLLGATGALISVSASNGVTTVTITEASPSPSASASPRRSASPSPSAAPKAAASPNLATTANCSAEAQAIAFQVKRVNTAFSGFHTDLEKARKDHSKDALEASDKKLKEIRQSAVKAIHATRTCTDEEDKDEDASTTTSTSNADQDEDTEDEDKDEDEDQDEHKTTSGLAFSGTAESIATQAIAAMQAAFDTAKAAPATTRKPEETRRPEGTRRPEAARTARPSGTPHRD